MWYYWKNHKNDIDKIKECINEKSFTNLVCFLIKEERKEKDNEQYFTKKYLDIAKQYIVDIYYNLKCAVIPEAFKMYGW